MDGWDIAIFGVAATLAGTLLGALVNHWLSVGRMRREREAGVRERWREQAFSVLGPLGTWLTDVLGARNLKSFCVAGRTGNERQGTSPFLTTSPPAD